MDILYCACMYIHTLFCRIIQKVRPDLIRKIKRVKSPFAWRVSCLRQNRFRTYIMNKNYYLMFFGCEIGMYTVWLHFHSDSATSLKYLQAVTVGFQPKVSSLHFLMHLSVTHLYNYKCYWGTHMQSLPIEKHPDRLLWLSICFWFVNSTDSII